MISHFIYKTFREKTTWRQRFRAGLRPDPGSMAMVVEKRRLLLVMALSATAAIASAAQPPAALIEVRPDGQRTVFTTQRLSRHDRLIAQYADAQGKARCCVPLRIVGGPLRRTDVSDELRERRVRAYALPAVATPDPLPFIGAALVLKAGGEPSFLGEQAFLAGATGNKAFPEVCTSSEGAHLLQSSNGKPQAHLYMHFDYAVEPTCSPESLKPFY
ncbi:hypothetical protein [Variovorax sp. KBW07]|uniref:hypothetical protein n=1 Tax=Variovorax sp. KBW07 TaxID=2153358 RepID=UPI000F576766|nr:hypothetical protein [Variovorax sp. KBW07]